MSEDKKSDFNIQYDLDDIFRESAEAKAFYAAVEKAGIKQSSANIALGLYGLDCRRTAAFLGIKLENDKD
ncbi:MAG: hypothetical protein LRZ85_09885 [Alphaproteobacteria bacterium]|nr:hypothetical protein [Alphaproteobacteria bacterium]MCD8525763.1 hypothetical protein [Alphaproteobacteria bacterium]MCD8571143.1 hypothetical protein [Alphaproteobacteria bacterium]